MKNRIQLKNVVGKIVVSSMVFATTLGISTVTYGNSATVATIETTIADYKVTEGKLLMELDGAGKTVTRTMIPLRGAFAELGFQVDWNADTQQATLKNDKYTVVVTKGKKEYTVNGKVFVSDVVPPLINGRFYVPLRSIGDNVGATTSWNNNTKRATIVLNGKGVYVQIGNGAEDTIDNRPKTTTTTKPSTTTTTSGSKSTTTTKPSTNTTTKPSTNTNTTKPSTNTGGSSSGGSSNNAGTTIIEGYDPFGGDIDTSYGGEVVDPSRVWK